MGKDLPLKTFLADERRFADIINGFCCAGEQRVRPEDLSELDTAEHVIDSDVGEHGLVTQKKKGEMRRDIIRKVALGVNFAIIGVENQEEEDYSLPYRIMSYDVSRYGKQVSAIKNSIKASSKGEFKKDEEYIGKQEKLSSGEYMYSFKKDSKLRPIVTIVLYYGKQEYNGATDLHGIIDFTDVPEHLKNMVNNYKVNLIDIRRCESFDMLHTDVKTVFELIRDSTDEDKWGKKVNETVELDKDALAVVAAYTNMKNVESLMEKYETKGGSVNMCQAWDDHFESGKKLGIGLGVEQGIEQGKEDTLRCLIKKGLLSISDAVKEFNMSEERLQELLKVEECKVNTSI